MKTSAAKLQRGVVFYVLLFVCLAVWGYVLYQIARGFGQAGDPFEQASLLSTMEATSAPASRRPGPGSSYRGDFRDPFERPVGLLTPKTVPAQRPSARAQPEPPPLALSGVVDGTALLQGEDGAVFVARAGERAGSVQVLTVQRDQVVVRFQGRAHTLHLSP